MSAPLEKKSSSSSSSEKREEVSKKSKQEQDEHRRLLEEKLLGIKTDRTSLAASMSTMAMVMAGADPLQEPEKKQMVRTQSSSSAG